MDNQEDVKVLDEDEKKLERREKNKKYAGYAGIGFAVGYISLAIFVNEPLWLFAGIYDLLDIIYLLIFVLPPILGGMAMGAMTKRWWGAAIGGGVGSVISIIVVLFLSFLVFD